MSNSSDVYDYYYENYVVLYNLYGRGRPRVSREQFEELDSELMTMISRGDHAEMSREDIARIRDIEYILMDDIAEALMDRPNK
jgi:hypothetical protein